MKQDKIRLIEGFLDESLSAAELEELLGLVRGDEAFREEFVAALRMWGLMHGAFHPDPRCERLSEVLGIAIGSKRNEGTFDSRVMKALEERQAGAGAGTGSFGGGRRSWPPRRRATVPGRLKTEWLAGAVAAGVLAGLVIFATWSSGERNPLRGKAADPAALAAEREVGETAREEATRKERERIEKELARIDSQRERLIAAEPKPEEKPDPLREEGRRRALVQLEEDRRRIEEERRVATERVRAPEGVKETPPSATTQGAKSETKTVAATLERVEGEVAVVSENGARRPAAARGDVRAGKGVGCVGAKSRAVVRFPDGTRLELSGDSEIREVFDLEKGRGKRVYLSRGRLEAVVTRQPADQPTVFATPHGEAQVLGTTLRLVVEPGEKGSTRVEVKEGRVKLTRPDGKTVNVLAGHVGVAAADLVVKPGVEIWKAPVGGLLLWLRADAGVKTSRTGVAIWADHSGNENHAMQPLPECQPALIPDAMSGRPALRFDGKDDFLQLPPGFNDFRAGLSAFVVARFTAQRSVDMKLLDLGSAPQTVAAQSGDVSIGVGSLSPKESLWVSLRGTQSNVKGSFYESPVDIVQNEIECLSAVVRGTGEICLYKNGVLLGAGQVLMPANALRSRNFIGRTLYAPSSPYFQGEIAEVILYSRALSEAERESVESYLEDKYRK